MMRRFVTLVFVLSLAAPLGAAEPVREVPSEAYTHPALGLTVLSFSTDLPPGDWEVIAAEPKGALEQAHLLSVEALQRRQPKTASRRLQRSEVLRRVESPRFVVANLGRQYREHAAAHGGVGPASLEDLRDTIEAQKKLEAYPSPERSPWHEDAGKALPGPFFFLVPLVPVPESAFRDPWPVPTSGGEPIVLELRPYVDDGRHWVAFSNGRVERVPVDAALLARHGLALSFVQPRQPDEPSGAAQPTRHMVLGLLRSPDAKSLSVTLRNTSDGSSVTVRVRPAEAKAGANELLGGWATARSLPWRHLLARGESPVLRAWEARLESLYGSRLPSVSDSRQGRAPERSTDAFSLLGGRAALRETLQMELLRTGPAAEGPVVPVESLKGVEVKSHPFEEMLAGREGGRLPLADLVPPDRLFVHFAKPAAVFPFLDDGAEFIFRAGSLATRSWIDDDLKGRYLRRLGLGEKHGRALLESGEVLELAVTASDLFFIDGTDVTLIMHVKRPDKLAARMKDLGVVDLPAEGIVEKATSSGGRAFWTRRGEIFAVSSRRAELEAVLALGKAGGAGSLGRSAEFRYMLERLPLRKETRAYAYLSDHFIRLMVSPQVKIGQLRRMRALAQAELVTAGALLHRLDGARDKPDLERLAKLGYVPADVSSGWSLRDDLSAVSPLWGTPAELAPIGAAPVTTVTPEEQQAYQTYVQEYARYWRQYFDPVAIRLDDGPGGSLELETFILPLLDSRLYDTLRSVVATGGGAPLRVPSLAPEPVLLLSLNLSEDAWVKASEGFGALFTRYTGIGVGLVDLLGPGLHLALQDSDPIVALGNADVLGGLAGPVFTQGMSREAPLIPLLLSVLTRPSTILVELRDEQAALAILRKASGGSPDQRREMQVEFRQVGGRDSWIYSLGVAGILKLRFGVEVRGGYLVVRNLPWAEPVKVGTGEAAPFNAAELRVATGAVRAGLPALFATEGEQGQIAALKGMAALYPLLLTVSATPEEAAARHAALFGSKPMHPGREGNWVWKEGRISSTAFGSPTAWRQPPWRPDQGDFGLFEGVERLAVNMQLEDAGLRARCRWIWGKPRLRVGER